MKKNIKGNLMEIRKSKRQNKKLKFLFEIECEWCLFLNFLKKMVLSKLTLLQFESKTKEIFAIMPSIPRKKVLERKFEISFCFFRIVSRSISNLNFNCHCRQKENKIWKKSENNPIKISINSFRNNI